MQRTPRAGICLWHPQCNPSKTWCPGWSLRTIPATLLTRLLVSIWTLPLSGTEMGQRAYLGTTAMGERSLLRMGSARTGTSHMTRTCHRATRTPSHGCTFQLDATGQLTEKTAHTWGTAFLLVNLQSICRGSQRTRCCPWGELRHRTLRVAARRRNILTSRPSHQSSRHGMA